MEDWIVFDCNHNNAGGLLLEVQDQIYRSDKNFEKELNFRGYISQPWRLVRTVWFDTSSFNKSKYAA